MKKKFYLRIGKGSQGILVDAHLKPNYKPFIKNSWRNEKAYPTVCIPVLIDLPESIFERAEVQLKIFESNLEPCLENLPLETKERGENVK